ncbi:MAG: hypothetical protein A2Z20_07325 [Bdellovibrionales bacterium RBG_16_40_8]|nr:MAG: hypothetical protein A2Z20_07325 [Bdellovibrionales bacterium RBG_16_40_8]
MKRFALVSLPLILILAVFWWWSRSLTTIQQTTANKTLPQESNSHIARVVNEQTEKIEATKPNLITGIEADKTSNNVNLAIKQKLQLLEEIINSKNDNDPRLDTEFNNLSAEMKLALTSQYKKISEEDRNGRGTIVFLVARDITSLSDLEFLQSVLKESPCLSLADCKQTSPNKEDSHLGSVDDLTMNYPQIVVLNRIETWLNGPNFSKINSQMLQKVDEVLNAGLASDVPMIADKAASILQQRRRL